ncbi:MAG TPA: hypothetical protein VI198_00895, partial [Candidatus Eisenbacteria bacterium]
MKPEIAMERDAKAGTKTMDEIWIQGGRRLQGRVACGGSKNATLPVLAAAMLAPGRYRFTNVPDLMDVATMVKMLGRFGITGERPE